MLRIFFTPFFSILFLLRRPNLFSLTPQIGQTCCSALLTIKIPEGFSSRAYCVIIIMFGGDVSCAALTAHLTVTSFPFCIFFRIAQQTLLPRKEGLCYSYLMRSNLIMIINLLPLYIINFGQATPLALCYNILALTTSISSNSLMILNTIFSSSFRPLSMQEASIHVAKTKPFTTFCLTSLSPIITPMINSSMA